VSTITSTASPDIGVKAELRAFALGLPEAWEDHPWGESVAKVGKKVFVFFGDDASERARSFTVKLRESHEEASAMGWTADPGYGLGRGGWLTVTAPEDAPMELLQAWILESYRAVAPKRLAEQVGAR
jgi:predicted DNA-binding protein (MmcQ/YjbR family)